MSTSDGYVCFSRDNFFSDNFFKTFYSTKRRTKRIKCEKKDRSSSSVGRTSVAGHLAAYARATVNHLRALLCAEQDAQCNIRESPSHIKICDGYDNDNNVMFTVMVII